MRKTFFALRSISTLSLTLALLLTGAQLSAQGPAGGGGGGGGGEYTLSIPDLTVDAGSIVDIPMLMEGDDVHFVFFQCTTNPLELEILSLEPGPGIEAYGDDFGPPPCDVIIFPSGLEGLIFFDPATPYSSTTYGEHVVSLRCMVHLTSGSTFIEVLNTLDQTFSTTTVTVGSSSVGDFSRGDVNGNGTCDVSDVVKLLEHLFVTGITTDCEDAADIDDDGQVVITDAILLLTGLFAGGDMPDGTCQADSTADSLSSCLTSACP